LRANAVFKTATCPYRYKIIIHNARKELKTEYEDFMIDLIEEE